MIKNSTIIQNFVNEWNNLHFKISLFISVMLTMCIPNRPVGENLLKYNYGFPINVITFYQQNETSNWFFHNFFNGNAGILFNPLSIIVNAIIIYFFVFNFKKILKKKLCKTRNG